MLPGNGAVRYGVVVSHSMPADFDSTVAVSSSHRLMLWVFCWDLGYGEGEGPSIPRPIPWPSVAPVQADVRYSLFSHQKFMTVNKSWALASQCCWQWLIYKLEIRASFFLNSGVALVTNVKLTTFPSVSYNWLSLCSVSAADCQLWKGISIICYVYRRHKNIFQVVITIPHSKYWVSTKSSWMFLMALHVVAWC